MVRHLLIHMQKTEKEQKMFGNLQDHFEQKLDNNWHCLPIKVTKFTWKKSCWQKTSKSTSTLQWCLNGCERSLKKNICRPHYFRVIVKLIRGFLNVITFDAWTLFSLLVDLLCLHLCSLSSGKLHGCLLRGDSSMKWHELTTQIFRLC